jgi:hypothetical protein
MAETFEPTEWITTAEASGLTGYAVVHVQQLGQRRRHSNVWCEMTLPTKQVGESKWFSAQLLVQPDAEVVQSHLSGKTGLEPGESVRALLIESKEIHQFGVDSLNYLADAGQPTAPSFRPRCRR